MPRSLQAHELSDNCRYLYSSYALPYAKPAFDWALVPSFLAVLEAGSLLGAAKRLGMHQPTL